ncbi:sugar dehydrogenase complex small subunit [Halomonas sp. WWR20]
MTKDARGLKEPLSGYYETELSRRQVMTGAMAAAAGTYLLCRWPLSLAQSTPAASAVAAVTPEEQAFLRFSQAITGHMDLHPLTARRIYQAMNEAAADFAAQAERLAALVQDGTEPKPLLESASEAGLRETALAVVAAWYTGTVENDDNPTVVAYPESLMYRPVADGQIVPTYCRYGPAWWTQPPPAADVSPPVTKTGEEPPTTGFPVPDEPPETPQTTPQNAAPESTTSANDTEPSS